MRGTGVRLASAAALALGLAVTPWDGALAQEGLPVRARELRGFDFAPDGVWRVRARRVREARAAAESRGEYSELNSALRRAGPAPAPLAVTGSLTVPVVLLRFANTDTTTLRDSSVYTQALFGATPPAGRPYTVRTLYEQMSNGLFSIRGNAVGWVALDSNELRYTGPATGCTPYGTCNGIFNSAALTAMQTGLREAVGRADPLVDFGQYDNDGPDGVANTADDDGFVDLVIFVQPARDGACVSTGNNHLWSHRWYIGATGGGYAATADVSHSAAGGVVQVRDYTLQSGVGGDAACDSTQLMPIGTAAHETGHGLDLPDFYDTNAGDGDDSEGIGAWGLMGSGNYYYPNSPSTFEALSRKILGWVNVLRLSTAGTYTFGPSALGDTVFEVRPANANPRGEHFLLENRQSVQADSALVTRKAGPGLLVWHVDSAQYSAGYYGGTVNSGPIHGLWLLQADGLNQLRSSTAGVRNRGDAGDPFPGSANNAAVGSGTAPNTLLNTGTSSGVFIDSITQLAAGAMRFRLRFGATVAVAASDTTAKVAVHGQAPVGRYRQFVVSGDTATIGIDSAQTDAAGTTRYLFTGWSDGGARSHLITAGTRDTAITAAVARSYDVRWTVAGSGTVVDSLGKTSGSWAAEGDSLILKATPASGSLFLGWSGDVTSSEPRLAVHATRAYSLTGTFVSTPLDSVVQQLLAGHGLAPAYVVQFDYLGNRNGGFDLGDFVAWLDQSGTTVSAELLARVFARVRQ